MEGSADGVTDAGSSDDGGMELMGAVDGDGEVDVAQPAKTSMPMRVMARATRTPRPRDLPTPHPVTAPSSVSREGRARAGRPGASTLGGARASPNQANDKENEVPEQSSGNVHDHVVDVG